MIGHQQQHFGRSFLLTSIGHNWNIIVDKTAPSRCPCFNSKSSARALRASVVSNLQKAEVERARVGIDKWALVLSGRAILTVCHYDIQFVNVLIAYLLFLSSELTELPNVVVLATGILARCFDIQEQLCRLFSRYLRLRIRILANLTCIFRKCPNGVSLETFLYDHGPYLMNRRWSRSCYIDSCWYVYCDSNEAQIPEMTVELSVLEDRKSVV